MKYIKCKNGITYKLEFISNVEKGKVDVTIWNTFYNAFHSLKVYYKPYKTLDDYMGNTNAGYYCIVPFPTGEKKRIYIFE